MKRNISLKELRQIRKTIEALPGVYQYRGTIQVTLALPEPCDAATRAFAHALIRGLKKVKCIATISFILSFSCHDVYGKPYEVLQHTPIATPCIRVYAQKVYKHMGIYGHLKKFFMATGKWIRPMTVL